MIPPVQQTLTSDAVVVAIVGTRIYQTVAPQETEAPYIVWSLVSATPENNLSTTPEHDDQRIQVDMYSASQPQCRELAQAVRDAIEAVTNITFGPWTDYEEETKLFRWSFDATYLNNR